MNRTAIYSWGPSGWTFLHAASYAYPNIPKHVDKMNMYNFLRYFASVIPCMRCRIDFTNYLQQQLQQKEESSVFKDTKSLVHFLVDAHNYVNVKLDKRIYSYAEVDELYIGSNTSRRCGSIIITITFLLVVCIGLYVFYRKHKKSTSNMDFTRFTFQKDHA